jgi:hypothetical protein
LGHGWSVILGTGLDRIAFPGVEQAAGAIQKKSSVWFLHKGVFKPINHSLVQEPGDGMGSGSPVWSQHQQHQHHLGGMQASFELQPELMELLTLGPGPRNIHFNLTTRRF